MSAPGAPAGGDAGQAQGQPGQQGDAAGAAAGGLDPAAVNAALESLTGGQEEMRQLLQGLSAQQKPTDPATPAEPEPVDLSFLDVDNPAFDPAQVAGQFQAAVQSEVQRIVSQEVGPVRDGLAEMRTVQEWGALVNEFPELNEEDTARPVLETAAEMAQQLAQAVGLPPEQTRALASSPRLAKLVYMAGRAADAANQEGQDVPDPATLESGNGAAPGPAGGNLGDAIFNTTDGRLGSKALPFA